MLRRWMSLRRNFKEDATHMWGIFHDLKEPTKRTPVSALQVQRTQTIVKTKYWWPIPSRCTLRKDVAGVDQEFDRKLMILNAKTEGDKHYLKDAIQKYRIEYIPGLKPSSRRLQKCLSYWEERLGDKGLPKLHLKLQRQESWPFDDGEMEALMRACKDHSVKLYTAVALALSTGGRQLEVWGLKKSDVDYKDGLLPSGTQNGYTRTVALSLRFLNG